MEWGGPAFVIAIIGLSTVGWLMNNWIRAKHGYALEDEWGGKTERKDAQEAAQLRAENARLVDRLEASEDRIAVLERIVTDRGVSVAQQIEALRDQRPAGRQQAEPEIDGSTRQ
jgi:hypothetical protein